MSSQTDQTSVSLDGYGWLIFASVTLAIAGVMRIIDGIWAFRYDGVVPDELEGALLGRSLSTYGWVWIIVGAILIASSFAIANRSQFARWIGIIAERSPNHHRHLVDPVLSRVVSRLHLHRIARPVRPRCPRRPQLCRRLSHNRRIRKQAWWADRWSDRTRQCQGLPRYAPDGCEPRPWVGAEARATSSRAAPG